MCKISLPAIFCPSTVWLNMDICIQTLQDGGKDVWKERKECFQTIILKRCSASNSKDKEDSAVISSFHCIVLFCIARVIRCVYSFSSAVCICTCTIWLLHFQDFPPRFVYVIMMGTSAWGFDKWTSTTTNQTNLNVLPKNWKGLPLGAR